MKTILLAFSLFCINSAFTQKIFSVKNSYQADVLVYVVQHQYQADLLVYKVKQEYQAKGNDGKWFFTDYEYQSKKKIFFVENEYQAKLKICFVDHEYQAGWKNTSKKHLMY